MTQNTITLEQAQLWAANWRKSGTNSVKAYWIPKIDVTEVLAEENVADVRGYLGIDENGEYKMMLVGVDADGNDLIDDTKGQYIYDFTRACPDFCDTKSPLFNI